MKLLNKLCHYCRRQLAPSTHKGGTAFTNDHIVPQAKGGTRKVPCCRLCNTLKGDLDTSAWYWIISNYPNYWKVFTHPHQVADAYRHEKVRRAKRNAEMAA